MKIVDQPKRWWSRCNEENNVLQADEAWLCWAPWMAMSHGHWNGWATQPHPCNAKSWPVQWNTNLLQHGKDQVDLRDNINFRRKHESRKIMKIVMSVGVVVEYSPCLDAWWACLLSMWWRLGSIQSSISISKLISFSCAKWKRISTLEEPGVTSPTWLQSPLSDHQIYI